MRPLSSWRALRIERVAQSNLLRRTTIPQNIFSRYASDTAQRDKFQGKRTTLNIKMPDPEEVDSSTGIDPSNVPFVPDLYNSQAKSAEIEAGKAGPKSSGEGPLPKVVTASAESTLHGVSSNVFQKTDDIKSFIGLEAQKASSKTNDATSVVQEWTNSLRNLQLPGLGSVAAASGLGASEGGRSDPKRTELDASDVQGLYVLLGIVAGGWLLGGIFSKKGTKTTKHGRSH